MIFRRILTISSIFKILRTVSDAKKTADVETNNGCTTFSSSILVIVPYILKWCGQEVGVITNNTDLSHIDSSSFLTLSMFVS